MFNLNSVGHISDVHVEVNTFATSSDSPQISLNIGKIISSLDSTDNPPLREKQIFSIPTYQKLISQLEITCPFIQLDEIEAKQIKIKKALQEHHWESQVFEVPEIYAFCALKAVEKNALKIEQFSTLMIYYSLTKYHQKEDIQSISLFKEKEINCEAHRLIQEALRDASLTAVQILKFFEFMSKLPKSEQQFFLIPHLEQPGKIVISEVIKNSGYNIFYRLNDPGLRMVPSFGMMQAYLNTKFTAPTTIIPILGESSLEDIKKNSLTKTRDMGLPYPGFADLPKTADFLDSFYDYNFIFHDFYHSIVSSSIPLKHAKAFVALSLSISELKEESKEGRSVIKFFCENLIDLGLRFYGEKDPAKITSTDFFLGLNELYKNVITQIILADHIKNGCSINQLTETDYLEQAKLLEGIVQDKKICKKICEKITPLIPLLKEHFSIDFDVFHKDFKMRWKETVQEMVKPSEPISELQQREKAEILFQLLTTLKTSN